MPGAEAKLETKCLQYVKKKMEPDWILLKWNSPGFNGVSDRLLLAHGHIIPIEFKAPGGKLSVHQREFDKRLTRLNLQHFVCDSFEIFVEICETIKKQVREAS